MSSRQYIYVQNPIRKINIIFYKNKKKVIFFLILFFNRVKKYEKIHTLYLSMCVFMCICIRTTSWRKISKKKFEIYNLFHNIIKNK